MRLLERWRARRAARRLRRELLFLGADVSNWSDQELEAASLELGRIAERSCFSVEEATKAFALLGAACRQATAFGTSLEVSAEEIAAAIGNVADVEPQGRLEDAGLGLDSDKPPCVPEDTRNQNYKNAEEGLGTIGPIPNSDSGPLLERLDEVDEKHHGDLPFYLGPGVYEDDEGEP